MLHGMNRDVFCQLEFIANGTLVHYSIPIERKRSTHKPDMRQAIEAKVIQELGSKPSLWMVQAKVVFCKNVDEILASVKEAQTEQIKIAGLRADGLLNPSPMGFSDVGDYMTAG